MSGRADHRCTILCVDDEAPILGALKRIFLDEDWGILVTTSAEEGLRLLASMDVDVVLCDYRMPEMNGVEFLKRAKTVRPECVRIVLSAYADINAVVAALNQGEIYRFLPKPWNDGDLLETVRDALQHRDLAARDTALKSELERANAELVRKLAALSSELARQASGAFTYALLEALPCPVAGVDLERRIAFANAAARSLFDQGDLPLVGRSAAEVLPDEVWRAVAAVSGGAEPICVGQETPLRVAAACAAGETVGVLVHTQMHDALRAAASTSGTPPGPKPNEVRT